MNAHELMRRRPGPPGPKPAASPPPAPGSSRPVLLDVLPEFEALHVSTSRVPVANPTITAGHSAWYKLGSWDSGLIGYEFGVMGGIIEMLPPDVDGAGIDSGANPLAWGAVTGLGAAIVVGFGLPGEFQAWSSGPADVPGVETAGSASISGRNGRSFLMVATFPTGKLSATTPNKGVVVRNFAPCMKRAGSAPLDVSLVVRRTKVHGLTGNLYGLFSVGLVVSTTRHVAIFGQ